MKIAKDFPEDLYIALSQINWNAIPKSEIDALISMFESYLNIIPTRQTVILGVKTLDAPEEFVKILNIINFSNINKMILKGIAWNIIKNLKKYNVPTKNDSQK